MAPQKEKLVRFIKKFKCAGNVRRKKYLEEASPEEFHSLCQCILNVVNGNIPINTQQTKKLRPYRKILKSVATGKNPIAKKKLMIQEGGFLPIIASALIPIIGSLVSKLIG